MKTYLAQRRVYAWLIDALIVLGIGILFHVLGWIAMIAYWLCRDGFFEGQSIGKRLMGLKVVVLPDRTHCTFKASMIRNLLWVVPLINVVMGVVGVYHVFNEAAGRHWGDRLADTRVVFHVDNGRTLR